MKLRTMYTPVKRTTMGKVLHTLVDRQIPYRIDDPDTYFHDFKITIRAGNISFHEDEPAYIVKGRKVGDCRALYHIKSINKTNKLNSIVDEYTVTGSPIGRIKNYDPFKDYGLSLVYYLSEDNTYKLDKKYSNQVLNFFT